MKQLLAILLFFAAYGAYAQPVLPDIMCRQQGRVVQLQWVCQYDGIKAIIVKRSCDSLSNYYETGRVANVQRGVQTFTDNHPIQGRSYYKLNIIFKSGLKWSSNHCGITTDAAMFAADSASEGAAPVTARIKFKLTQPDIDQEDVFTDPVHVRPNKVTGHIDVLLPDDYARYNWSLVFYNTRNERIMDIPELKAKKVIIDRRNFQRRGKYRFELRRNGVVFENGYITVGK